MVFLLRMQRSFHALLEDPADHLIFSLPAGTTEQDIQQACTQSAFPSVAAARTSSYLLVQTYLLTHILLMTASSQETLIPECPDGDTNLADCPS